MKRPLLAPGFTYVEELGGEPMPILLARPVRALFRAWDNVGDEVKLQFVDQYGDEIARLLGLLGRAGNENKS